MIMDAKSHLTAPPTDDEVEWRTVRVCRQEPNAEYDGTTVVKWGTNFTQPSAVACCEACRNHPRCDLFVYCASATGCGAEHAHGECWLKREPRLNPLKPMGRRGPEIGWTSGTVMTQERFDVAQKRVDDERSAEASRLSSLRGDDRLPLVFFEVAIKGKPIGRIEFVLFTDTSPRSAENFRRLCTGEQGIVPEGREGAGKPYHFKGASFYRIIDQFIDQGGVEIESALGGAFKDDSGGLKLKHEHKGLLSMANAGPNTNTAHFSIMINPAPHLDSHYTIFGQAVTGFNVIDAVNALSVDKPDHTATAQDGAVILDCGQLRKGTLQPNLEAP